VLHGSVLHSNPSLTGRAAAILKESKWNKRACFLIKMKMFNVAEGKQFTLIEM